MLLATIIVAHKMVYFEAYIYIFYIENSWLPLRYSQKSQVIIMKFWLKYLDGSLLCSILIMGKYTLFYRPVLCPDIWLLLNTLFFSNLQCWAFVKISFLGWKVYAAPMVWKQISIKMWSIIAFLQMILKDMCISASNTLQKMAL